METKNCCTGCAGIDDNYSCLNHGQKATVYPLANVKPETNVKNKGKAKIVTGFTATVKKEEPVKEPVCGADVEKQGTCCLDLVTGLIQLSKSMPEDRVDFGAELTSDHFLMFLLLPPLVAVELPEPVFWNTREITHSS
ncbi:3-ketoacyl-CoA synthase 6 [Striga asiatica]|uniref:3-ketoacyl-CoA synthase 6 n=1 Tax=Striga asiatica TaxID=4170 RepID=A0A5A7P9H1_STRAF|nr:3-ketoacyl-CoA synthase 6 [Striga asiatica]